MSKLITRRTLIASLAGVAGAGSALYLGARHSLIPPDHQGLFGAGETLTYAAQRLLVSKQALAREFDRSVISKIPEVNGPTPYSDDYLRLRADDFSPWRLTIDGMVARPGSYSLADIRRMPRQDQITLHVCEEGWSFIAEWTGVRLSYLLELVGISPQAKYVVFTPFDDWWGSLDMTDALHDQTLLTYGMNGRDLPLDHGAPLRLRVARQLGYASIKYLKSITVTDSLDSFGLGLGSAAPEIGYSWYGGI